MKDSRVQNNTWDKESNFTPVKGIGIYLKSFCIQYVTVLRTDIDSYMVIIGSFDISLSSSYYN